MLKSLIIHNFVIIDKIVIDFSKGYTVFTGETGSGKSIILEALLLTMGAKASSEVIKKNAEKASIVASYIINNDIYRRLKEHDIEVDSNEIIIRRVINKSGVSKAYINDIPISLNLLKILSNLFLDVHGQFDNQMLLNKSAHIELVDSFIDKHLLKEVESAYTEFKNTLSDYITLVNNITEISKEREYLSYVVKELEVANISENEELELIEKRTVCLDSEKLKQALQEVHSLFTSDDNILAKLHHSLRVLDNIKLYLSNNANYNNIINKLDKCYAELLDSEALVQDILHSLQVHELDINHIENRLSLIRSLSKKHKVSSNDLCKIKTDFEQKLIALKDSEVNINTQETVLANSKNKFVEKAQKLSDERVKVAKFLSNKVNQELQDLYLKGVTINIKVNQLRDNEKFYSTKGFDEVYFSFSANLNSEPKNINKIASGGELARVMLAVKVALVEKVTPLLIIFDEIDVGVGGKVAYSIGKKLEYLSRFSQVIVITHSHQVAAVAHHHYKVIKSVDKDISTLVNCLNYEERILELARMISANEITKDAKAIAKSLLKLN